jgi:hypothetical protein
MNRERDSEIIHDMVTSKYKIAERNRLAKIKFLSNTSVDQMNDGKRRDSEPSLVQTERVEVRPMDLSVPGTPVSSHYLASLRKMNRKRNDIETDSESDDDDDGRDDKQSKFTKELQDGLKQFTSDMEKLQQSSSHDTKEEAKEEVKKEPALSRVEQYFKESARRGSLTRDFTEVVQKFDPKMLHENGKAGHEKPGTPVSSKFIKAEKVSSTKLASFDMKKFGQLQSPEAVKQAAEKMKVEEAPEKPKRVNPVPLTPTITPATPPSFDKNDFPPVSSAAIDKKDSPRPQSNESASSDSSTPVIVVMPPVEPEQTLIIIKEELLQSIKEEPKKEKKSLKRNDSSVSIASNRSDMSVPGTPVDSRRLFLKKVTDDFSDDDSDMEIIDSSEVKALAQEFADKIDSLVQKTMDEDNDDDKDKKEDSNEKENDEKEQKLLIIHETAASKVKDYFDQSEKEKSYQRTFSEVDTFNVPTLDVKEKVEKFFKDSEEKRSLTRGFSEAVNYIEPVDIEMLFKPGTPVSSKTVESLRREILGDDIIEEDEREIDPVQLKRMEVFQKAHGALHQPPPVDFKVNEYFEESKERQTLKRDFSEVYGEIGGSQKPTAITNPSVQKFFEESDAQKSFRRQFSEAFQTLPPRIKDILVEQQMEQQKSGRSTSIFSAPPDCTDAAAHQVPRKSGKKYGVDKYFATSLYRTAYHRNNADRRGSEPNHSLAILEDEYVFGETDALRSTVFQDDDETPIRKNEVDGDFEQQNVQFWRDFLKPYTLNLPTDIVMRDELIDKYTKYTLE